MRHKGSALAVLAVVLAVEGCQRPEVAERTERLSIRLEHEPPSRVPADSIFLLTAFARSTLAEPHVRVTFHVRGQDGTERTVAAEPTGKDRFTARLGPWPRGTLLSYTVTATDAWNLSVRLPARRGSAAAPFTVPVWGHRPRLLSWVHLSLVVLALLSWIGAGAAALRVLSARAPWRRAVRWAQAGLWPAVPAALVTGPLVRWFVTGRPLGGGPAELGPSFRASALLVCGWALVLFLAGSLPYRPTRPRVRERACARLVALLAFVTILSHVLRV